jgi:hypothetical protein
MRRTRMPELTPQQMKTLERLFAAGFRPIAIPPYESVLCVRRGECVAVLTPAPGSGLRLLAPPSYLVAGNISVRLQRDQREVFAWKKNEVEATAERLAQLAAFRQDLTNILEEVSAQ